MKNSILFILLGLFVISPQMGFAFDNSTLKQMIKESKTRADIVEVTQKAVVHIKVEKTVDNMFGRRFHNNQHDFFDDEFFKRFFPNQNPRKGFPQQPRKFKQQGAGSGSIIDKKGHILTNNHVIKNAEKITVQLIDGREFKATVIGSDPLTDIAVIKIDSKNLNVIPMGDSDEIRIGETVIAIGNPFGLSHTVTMGIVSAKGRSNVNITDYEDFIQTDAAINPGNSGGPLIDLEGKMIGVNTAIFTQSGGYQGIGFSVPVNMAKEIMQQLIEDGEVSRGWLGILLQDIDNDLAEAMGLENSQGALVADVNEGSPAEKGGLEQGDVIVKYQGKAIKHADHLKNEVGLTSPNTRVKIEVIRSGKNKVLTVKLGSRPSSNVVASRMHGVKNPLGISVQTLTPEIADQYGHKNDDKGVFISFVAPQSAAQRAGLKVGHVILQVNSKAVNTPKDFESAMKSIDNKKGVLLLISTESGSRFIIVKTDG